DTKTFFSSLLDMDVMQSSPHPDSGNPILMLKDYFFAIGEVSDSEDIGNLVTGILSGDAVILVEGQAKGLILSLKGWRDRGVAEPESQSLVRGPREGFTETYRTNTALIRRKIRDPTLRLETMQI